LPARLLRCAPSGGGTITPALALSGRPPGIGTGEDVLDVVVDQHDVEFPALLAIMPGKLRISFPLNPVICLRFAQEDTLLVNFLIAFLLTDTFEASTILLISQAR
jgi:hypothetical protein